MQKTLLTAIVALAIGTKTLATTQTPMAQTKTLELRILETSDVHGCFFPYDFTNRRPMAGSMARISSYVNELRAQYGSNLLLLENGDILQGQPTNYYYNYIARQQQNIAASVINYMQYDAQTFGNHDVETGHAVNDKWPRDLKCSTLGASIINTPTEKPYVRPYKVFVRDGVRICVLGMLTPAIPNWLEEKLWEGLRFEEMISSAKQWVDYIQRNEHPDVLIGLFHSGWQGGITTAQYEENASRAVAEQVPGFDIVFYGHDHRKNCETVTNIDNQPVLCLDPSNNAQYVCDATVTLTIKKGKVVKKSVKGTLIDVRERPVDEAFMQHFAKDIDSINSYVNKKIGTFENAIYTRDSFFGSSAFCDFIHNLQLQITGADISFNAPLSFNASIPQGDICVGDMFNLYKYENKIYIMLLTGKEIRGHLEMSYNRWVNQMTSPNDHILMLDLKDQTDTHRYAFKNMTFNFDSAAGIDYEVDVTKPVGQMVNILRMSNGEPFDEAQTYRVVMNSYRGNGGGELLTLGAGIPHEELRSRIVYESELDQRYYLMQVIEQAQIMNPQPNNNWRFVPDSWAKPALERDRKLLFGE